MKTLFHIQLLLVAALFVLACNRTPRGVLSARQMEDLLVDIHKAESYIENGTAEKITASGKKEALRESVFRKHHTDKEQFDTSLMWYGRNLDKYIEIYDHVIQRLKEQEAQVSGLMTDDRVQPVTTRPGDSVDVWRRDNFYLFEPRVGRQTFTFEFNADENYREQDIFVLKLRFGMLPGQPLAAYPRAVLALKQSDDSIRYTSADIRHDGITTLMLASDKGTKAVKVFGSIMVPASLGYTTLYADSMSLMRIRYRDGILPRVHRPAAPARPDTLQPKPLPVEIDSVLKKRADTIPGKR